MVLALFPARRRENTLTRPEKAIGKLKVINKDPNTKRQMASGSKESSSEGRMGEVRRTPKPAIRRTKLKIMKVKSPMGRSRS